MPVNEIILELAKEMVDPVESMLEDEVEDAIEIEDDILTGTGDAEDELIEFIASGNRLFNVDPVELDDEDLDDDEDDDDEDLDDEDDDEDDD